MRDSGFKLKSLTPETEYVRICLFEWIMTGRREQGRLE